MFFTADINLDKNGLDKPRFLRKPVYFLGKRKPVNRLDKLRFADNIFRLVRLQRTDKMRPNTLRGEKIEFIAKFLCAIFADLRKPGLERRQYLRAGFEFCCAHKPNFGRIAAGFVCCFRNFIANTAIIFRSLSRSVLFV